MDKPKLPPLEESVFDGYKSSATMNPDKKCKHEVTFTGHALQCKKCGVGYTGGNLAELQRLFSQHYNK